MYSETFTTVHRNSRHHEETEAAKPTAAPVSESLQYYQAATAPPGDCLQYYPRLRKAFNTSLRAQLRDFENVVLCSHDNLLSGGELPAAAGENGPANKFYADSLQLSSSGMRKMCRNWDTVIKRMVRTAEGQLYCRYSGSSY
jgi:hypothetical protein